MKSILNCGVYQIKNTKNNKVYIGSCDLSKRINDHKSKLRIQHVFRLIEGSRVKISQYKGDDLIASHASLMDAARSLGKKTSSRICSAANGKIGQAYGFTWRKV